METGMRPLTDEEVTLMLQAMTGGKNAARNQTLLQLGIFTGFRISELLSIKVGDVWDGYNMRPRVTVGKGFMKGKKVSRTLPLNPAGAIAIKRWLSCVNRDNSLFLDWPLFAAQGRRKSISRQLATRVLVEAAERSGIDSKRIGGHSLRKTFATKAWQSSEVAGDMAKMAKLLGHSNWSNTLRYIEFLDGSIDQAVMQMSVG
jgi:integrase